MDRKPGVPNESISMKGKLPTVLTELAATVITTLQRAAISARARHFDLKKKKAVRSIQAINSCRLK